MFDCSRSVKILAISEEAGIGEAAYALKLLQSEGELRHLCVGKNAMGRMHAQEYHVKGPVQLMMTTTSTDIDPELAEPLSMVLTVDESAETRRTQFTIGNEVLGVTQTGLPGTSHCEIGTRSSPSPERATSACDPLEVYNPYAPQLTFA